MTRTNYRLPQKRLLLENTRSTSQTRAVPTPPSPSKAEITTLKGLEQQPNTSSSLASSVECADSEINDRELESNQKKKQKTADIARQHLFKKFIKGHKI